VKVKHCSIKILLLAQQFFYGFNMNFDVLLYILCYGDFYMMIPNNYYNFYACELCISSAYNMFAKNHFENLKNTYI
jgi:hypothetical protein